MSHDRNDNRFRSEGRQGYGEGERRWRDEDRYEARDDSRGPRERDWRSGEQGSWRGDEGGLPRGYSQGRGSNLGSYEDRGYASQGRGTYDYNEDRGSVQMSRDPGAWEDRYPQGREWMNEGRGMMQGRGYEDRGYEDRGYVGATRGNRGYDDRSFGQRGYGMGTYGQSGYQGGGSAQGGYAQGRGYEDRNAMPGRGYEGRDYGSQGYGGTYGRDQGSWAQTRGQAMEDRGSYPMGVFGRPPGEQQGSWGGMQGNYGMHAGQQGSWGAQSGYGQGQQRGGMYGRGPLNYTRSDQRIYEDVCDALSDDEHVDASQVEVKVEKGEVTLTGSVQQRDIKRRIEDVVERVSGVKEINNQIKVQRQGQQASTSEPQQRTLSQGSTGSTTGSTTGGTSGGTSGSLGSDGTFGDRRSRS